MNEQKTSFGTKIKAYLAILVGAVILSWLAFRIISGFIHTLVIIAIIAFAIYALNWGLGARGKKA